VAFTLCLRALGRHRVRGIYVDTGLMREARPTSCAAFSMSSKTPSWWKMRATNSSPHSLGLGTRSRNDGSWGGVRPVQERAIERYHFLDNDWILGQGTIYPDTIEAVARLRRQ